MFKQRYFKLSWKVTLIGLVFIASFLRLAYWQWERHLEKQAYINTLEARVKIPVAPLQSELLEINALPDNYINRRYSFSGDYDFSQEFYIRNRSIDSQPGVLAVTPLKLKDSTEYVLVSRGFIPLKEVQANALLEYQQQPNQELLGLLKSSAPRRYLAPEDPPTGKDLPRVTEFLRMDIEHISKQLPYPVAPFYLELLPNIDPDQLPEQIVRGSSDKEELLFLPMKALKERPAEVPQAQGTSKQPIMFLSTVVPTTRHLGYVFEWSAMALMTLLICLVLQFKRPSQCSAVNVKATN